LLTKTFGVDGGTIILTPTNGFHPGELVQATATTGTLSLAGMAPITPTVWQFWTAVDGGWGQFAASGNNFGIGSDATWSVALGDVDGDGDLDPAVGNRDGQNVGVLHGGDGTFGSGNNFGTGSDATWSVVLGDMDGDGDLDVAVGNAGQQNVVYLNDGDGTFPISTTFGTGSDNTSSVALGDVDGDGDLDAAVGNFTGQQNVVYLNDGDGSFGSGNNLGPGSDWTVSVALGDVEGDGELDAGGGNRYFVSQNMVYLNDGDGSFGSGNNFGPENDWTRSVALGDVDGDGDLDAAVGNSGQNVVYLNDGDGTFGSGNNFGTGNDSTYSVALGDVDGDGDLDLAVGNESQQNVVYLNDGNGTFGSGNNFGTGSDGTVSVALGDVDGDGDLDAAVGSYNGQNVVYPNVPDLAISKAVIPTSAMLGQPITYTLTFSNASSGSDTASGPITITDNIPVSVTAGSLSYVSTGAAVTATGSISYVWNVEALSAGEWGVITVTGVLSQGLSAGPFSNTATIASAEGDSDALNNSSTVSVTVQNVAPVARDDGGANYTTDEDTAFTTGDALSNDSDSNGDTLSVDSIDTTGTQGQVTDNGDGTFEYDPNGQFESLAVGEQAFDTFAYVVSDGALTGTATVSITINGVNDSPLTLDDTFTVDEDSIDNSLDVLLNDFDRDGDTLTISAVGPVYSGGGTAVNGGTVITYTPLADFYGVETFTYTIGDGNGGFDTGVVSVIVEQGAVGNNPPVAVDDTAVTAWATPVTVTVLDNDSDPDSDTISVIAVGAAANGTTAYSNPVVTYTSDVGFTGTDSFSYTISDGEDSDTALVTVTVAQAHFVIDADDPTDVSLDLPGACSTDIQATVGAVPIDMDVLYNPVPAPVIWPPNHEFVGCAFTLNAYQDGVPQDDLDFDVPISVTLTYEDPSIVGLDVDSMRLFAQDEDSDVWSTDGITRESLDPVARRHTSRVGHLTLFALFAQPEPALYVYKSVDTGGLDPVPLGSVVTYTLVIDNRTDAVASSVVLTDPLPSAVTFDDWVMYGGSAMLPPPGTVNLPPVTVEWSPGDIAAGTAYTLSFTANVITDTQFAGDTVVNTAYVIADNADLDSDSVSFRIEGGESYIYLPLILRNAGS
ncbi:MAG: tandem-95 repeat protein, partial [Chloroflexi bacterium]|nr:tandem-95 repeat protein [Chloroflexota bacterium]